MVFKVSAVLATRRRKEKLERCLASLEQQPLVTETIIVEDRGPDPRGCCRSRNMGAAQACSEATHLYFTDDDCEVMPGCVERLASPGLWDSPYTGATGGSCINMSDRKFRAYSYKYMANPMRIDVKGEIRDLSEFWVDHDAWWPADHLRGGNLLVSRRAFEAVGGFGSEFGPGSLRGETDFCLKLRDVGFSLYFNPVARVLHFKTNRPVTALEKRYDSLWREKWQPRNFLGSHVAKVDRLLQALKYRAVKE